MTDFEHYLEGYCKKHECTEAEAKTHAMVRNVEDYYKNAENGKISVTKIDAGCGAGIGECK